MLAWDHTSRLLAQWAAIPVRLWAFSQELRAAQIVDVFSRHFARASLRAAGAYFGVMGEFIRRWCGPQGFSFLFGFPSLRPLKLDQKSDESTPIPDLTVPQFRRPIVGKKLSRIPLGIPAAGLFAGGQPPLSAVEEVVCAHEGTRFFLAAMDSAKNLFLGMWNVA